MLPLSTLLRASAYLAFGLGVFGMLLAVGPNLAEAEQDGTKSPFETSGPTLIDGKVVRDGGSNQENSGAQPAAGGDSLSPDGGTAVESGALGPDQTPARVVILDAQEKARQGDLQGAMLMLDQALASGNLSPPLKSAAATAKGNMLYRAKRWQDAIQAFDLALQQAPQNGRALRGRCFARVEVGDIAAAEQDCTAAAALFDNAALSADTLGFVAMRQRKVPEALAFFDQAIAADPNYASAYLNKGITLYLAGNEEGGRSNMLKAQELEPNNPDVTAVLKRYGLIY